MAYDDENNIKQVLMGYFPNLDEKEFTVYKMITYAHHDMEYGCYHYIVATTAGYNIFCDEKDVQDRKTYAERSCAT
jgi:hypothetical protein